MTSRIILREIISIKRVLVTFLIRFVFLNVNRTRKKKGEWSPIKRDCVE